MELGLADRQRALRRVVVSDGQPGQLSASQARGGQHHDREAHVLGVEWRLGAAGQRARDGQQVDELAVGEDVRPDGLVDRRKQPLVGDEAAGLSTSAIQTQVSHDPHAGSTRAGGQMLQGETPGGERLGDEIDAAGREEPIQVRQYHSSAAYCRPSARLSVR